MIYFVTGGSRGIGEAIVLQAVREGHDAAFTYRTNGARAEEVIAKAKAIDPSRKVRAYELDVTSSATTSTAWTSWYRTRA
jgi:3-oxoacyl-[acyl-carrier protein] reductase